MQGDLIRRIEANLDFIGHIQIAAVPDRAEPDHGELAYKDILLALNAAGYDGFIGAEYRPAQYAVFSEATFRADSLAYAKDIAQGPRQALTLMKANLQAALSPVNLEGW